MLRLQRFAPIAPASAFHRRLHSSNQQTRGVRLTWAKMQVFHACHVPLPLHCLHCSITVTPSLQASHTSAGASDVLSLAFDDGHDAQAHAMWLRHNCPSYFSSSGQVSCDLNRMSCMPPRAVTSPPPRPQRIVSITDIPPPPLSSIRLALPHADGAALDVEFNDGHRTQFPAAWLREYRPACPRLLQFAPCDACAGSLLAAAPTSACSRSRCRCSLTLSLA
jgi:DUF971 family protein